MTIFPKQDARRPESATDTPALALDGLDSALDLLRPYFRNHTQEHLRALYIDGYGTLCGMGAWSGERTLIDMPVRRILASALAADAAAIVLAHNHPSGDPNPSMRDVQTTRKLARICAGIDIKLLDHVIIAGEKATSMRMLRLI